MSAGVNVDAAVIVIIQLPRLVKFFG